MFKQFPKIFFFTTLAVAVALIVSIFFTSLSDPYISMLANWSSQEVSSALVVFSIPFIAIVCAIIAFLTNLIIYSTTRKKQGSERNKNSFFIYYLISLALTHTLTVICAYIVFNPNDYHMDQNYVHIGAVIAILFNLSVLGSLILSAIYVGIKTVWKQNKAVGIILSLFCLLLLSTTYVVGIFVKDFSGYKYDDDPHNYSNEEDDYDGDEDYNYYEDDYPDEAETSFFSFLWYNDESDYSNVQNAASRLINDLLSSWPKSDPNYLLEDLDWTEYYIKSKDNDYPDQFDNTYQKEGLDNLRKIYRYCISSPTEVQNVFDAYSFLLYEYISPNEFRGSGAEAMLDDLLIAYSDLYSDNDLHRLKKIYELMTLKEKNYANDSYDELAELINRDNLEEFSHNDEIDESLVIWTYSFWARRNAEGIDNDAHYILSSIKSYYDNAN